MASPASSLGPQGIVELIGVYNANGGPIGEAKYVIGSFLGRVHCALCDVTHSPFRRKPQWDRLVQELGLPVTLLHLNEMPADVAVAVSHVGSPSVLARLSDRSLRVVLDPVQLERLGGSVDGFGQALRRALNTGDTGM